MSATMNGHAMSIGYGEGGTMSDTLAIGRNYCHNHLPNIPQLTREEIVRAGGIFPPPAPLIAQPKKRKVDPAERKVRPITDYDRARIVAGWADGKGKPLAVIGREIGRAAACVRRVLRQEGYDTSAHAGHPHPYRERVVEMIQAGATVAEVVAATGARREYVHNTASKMRVAARQKEAA